MNDHPIFEKFQIQEPRCRRGFIPDSFVGTKRRRRYIDESLWPSVFDTAWIQSLPPLDDEYFEWIDLLEAVDAADGTFTIFELGAGYGRWSVRGAVAARQRGQSSKIVAVEPERQHFRWLKRHLRDHRLQPRDHILKRAVVNGTGEPAEFTVGMPNSEVDGPSQWYGQAMYWEPAGAERRRTTKEGWVLETVPAVTLSDLLARVDRVDLIDMDLQGAEFDVVSSAIDQLDAQVRRLHIGTHGMDIECNLRELLNSRGWEPRADYGCGQTCETDFGTVAFDDGVQSWVNPALEK